MLHEPQRRPFATGRTERRGAAKTAADIVHSRLREEIVTLAWPPGPPISEKEIAAAHGVSRTPVREALLRLADEGLVEGEAKPRARTPMRGALLTRSTCELACRLREAGACDDRSFLT